MAKRQMVKRGIRRAGGILNGVLSSATRTLYNNGFIMAMALCWYLLGNEAMWAKIVAMITKVKVLEPVAAWVKDHTLQATAIVTLFVAVLTSARQSIAMPVVAFGTALVYNGHWKLSFLDIAGLSFGLCWFARTSSYKIRMVIFLVYFYLSVSGQWGNAFIKHLIDDTTMRDNTVRRSMEPEASID
jgi:hypothetical protein